MMQPRQCADTVSALRSRYLLTAEATSPHCGGNISALWSPHLRTVETKPQILPQNRRYDNDYAAKILNYAAKICLFPRFFVLLSHIYILNLFFIN